MITADVDKGFTADEFQTINKYGFLKPSEILDAALNDKNLNFHLYQRNVNRNIKTLGHQKGGFSKNKKMKDKNSEKIEELTEDI